ncbi:methylated-DNA-[protein]-cysteine S-methyltransferase [Saccharopolyspora lacisalsi]|uniref:Methylated-DNA--protein-cysteine methyltransferase n=1 Tax=Halosaccharopolyspora lacisalsi TaxID=1000566 RepID=A0A839DVE3_9PSEU|nr:methylated-DNA--[protein]-cysteine S-methyltransferase [Halosaccharopolyspora lacisalsi]MBA8824880.1 methylated-DNA-[protein]-cysteine S-methyltransferase [Halosaccharopolyspora lacisalsi]
MTTSDPEPDSPFAASPPENTEIETHLRERLITAAREHGVLDLAYRALETPVGTLLLVTTEQGLVRVAYDREDHEAVLGELAETISPRVLHAPRRLDEVSHQLEEYFAGRRTAFDVALDWQLSRGFRREVLRKLPGIGYGATASYAHVAAAAGSPRAVRAVGTACATNPLPVVVPCHRVVRSDGSAGGYIGGAEAKRALLDLETTT